MLKILIVDDEPLVRRCLKETIDWESLGFTVVGEASNGQEALMLTSHLRPDIILTDIMMKKMNGLDMVEQLKNSKNDVEIIIITGYENFEFAKRALENNVAAYILKPVLNETIIDAVLKLKEKIKNKSKIQIALSEHNINRGGAFLSALLKEEAVTNLICSQLAEKYDVTVPSNLYTVSLLQLDKSPASENRFFHLGIASLKDTLSFCISTSVYFSIFCETDNNSVLLVTFLSDNKETHNITPFLNDIKTHFTSTGFGTITIGVSKIFKNLAIIKRAVIQAKTALSQKARIGGNRIIEYSENSSPAQRQITLSSETIHEIISDIKAQNAENAAKTVSDWIDDVSKNNPQGFDTTKNSVLELTILILRTFFQNPYTMVEVFGRKITPAIELQNIEYFSDLKDWSLNIINGIGSKSDVCAPFSYSPLMQKAILYIHENYASKITIDSLANRLYTSRRSLTRCFKSETGKTFNEYLTDYRMEIAKNMLRSDTYKIFEIGNLVGYTDQKHFHKTFKRVTGHNPTYYKSASSDGGEKTE